MKEFIEKLIGRLEEKFKYNSEQAEIYRDGSDKDAYFREKKDLYMDRANTYGEVMRIVNQLAEEYKADKVNQLAMMYAQNMAVYGIDVTHKWETATSQSAALNEAYLRGLHDERKYQYMQMKNKVGWIPCSERLPENTDLEYFLVWCKGYFTEGTHIGEECQWYGIGLLYNKNKWEVYQCKDIKDIEVIAWQPLPAPYKKGCE